MKKIFSLLAAALLLLALALPVFADTGHINSTDKADHDDGMPYWYPYDWSGFTDFHGEDLPVVVDDADILTDEEESRLEAKIRSINEKYGVSYVFFSDDDNHGLTPEEYSSDFLHFNGYGAGDGYGAVVFYLCFEPGNRCWRTTVINSYEDIFTADIMYDIDETIDSSIRSGDYFEGCMLHAGYVGDLFDEISSTDNWTPSSHEYRYIEPEKGPSLFKVAAIGLFVGLFIAFIRVSSLKKQMRINAPAGANLYLDRNSFVIRNRTCSYLYTTVTKRAKPKESSSSGRGGSSYSSGHSSGGSYSSGGRSF